MRNKNKEGIPCFTYLCVFFFEDSTYQLREFPFFIKNYLFMRLSVICLMPGYVCIYSYEWMWAYVCHVYVWGSEVSLGCRLSPSTFAVEPGRLAGWPENFQGCSRPVVHLLRMVLSWKGPLSVFLVFYIESEDLNFGQMLSFWAISSPPPQLWKFHF